MSDDGWRRMSAIMDSDSVENIAKDVPLMETEASCQGQTYHTADGCVIENKG